MAHDVWLALFVGLIVQASGIPFALTLPETLYMKPGAKPALEGITAERPDSSNEDIDAPVAKRSLFLQREWHKARHALHILHQDASLTLVILSFLVFKLGAQSMNLLLPYVSKRFHWPLSKVEDNVEHTTSSIAADSISRPRSSRR